MTAVEYLLEQIRNNKFIGASEQIEVIYQAKEMEKQEKHAEYMRGWKDGYVKNETYKNTKE